MRQNPVERKSLQEQSRRRLMENEGLNIPLYADNVFTDEIKRREQKMQIEKENEEYQRLKEKEKQERKEEKNKLLKFSEINGYLLALCAVMIILLVTSIFVGSFLNTIYSIIAIISTIYIGRRLTFKIENFDEVGNILLWNITQTLNDFIEYKIDYDIKGSYEGIIKKASVVMLFSLLFLNSNSIIYGLSLLILIVGFIMAIAFRDFNTITSKLNKLIICAIIGVFIKAVISFFVFKVFTIDFFNVVLVNVFLIINLLNGIELEEPIE